MTLEPNPRIFAYQELLTIQPLHGFKPNDGDLGCTNVAIQSENCLKIRILITSFYWLYIVADKHEEAGITEQNEATAQTDERCSFPNQLSNDARAIARIDNKCFCQINQEALAYYVNRRKLRDDCRNNLISGPDCKCAEYQIVTSCGKLPARNRCVIYLLKYMQP